VLGSLSRGAFLNVCRLVVVSGRSAAFALAVLNSTVGRNLLAAINPTVIFQVGDLAELPMLTAAPDSAAGNRARLIELASANRSIRRDGA